MGKRDSTYVNLNKHTFPPNHKIKNYIPIKAYIFLMLHDNKDDILDLILSNMPGKMAIKCLELYKIWNSNISSVIVTLYGA